MKRKISSIDFKCIEKLIKKIENLYYTEVKQKNMHRKLDKKNIF